MRKSPSALALVVAAALFALTGCSVSAPRPTPTPNLAPVIFSGKAVGAKIVFVPEGVHSASITVACGGQGFFELDGALNKNGSGLRGDCESGTHRYELALTPRQSVDLHFQVTKNGRFVVETRLSPDRFVGDPELVAQCKAMVDVGSDVFNAEDGYTRGALTLAEWNQRIADASSALQPSLTDKTNILSATLKAIDRTLRAEGIAPGAFANTSEYTSAVDVVGQVCSASGHELYVNAEFGG